ncbi:MAG: iron-only hydrogenase system regulator [Oscillospiraceae bacterium]|jgi:putative iron-only hydrogenase system regulator|nr:iron-only hydrogenase system regulator [Oscillospiraceae bacterium]
MEERIALIGLILESKESVNTLNEILHEYNEYIVGRMGLPKVKENVGVISIVLNASNDVISALSGKLGSLEGVTAKTIYAKA